MDSFLDKNITEIKLLPDFLRSLEKQKIHLKSQLSGTDSKKSINEWQNVVCDVRDAVSRLETLNVTCQSLIERVTHVGGEGLSGDARECARSVQSLVEEVLQLEHLQSYLLWLQSIRHLHLRIESDVSNRAVLDAVESFFLLKKLCSHLDMSECFHLKSFALNVKQYWNFKLKETLSNEFSVILGKLKWPLATQSISSNTLNMWDKYQLKFVQLFKVLVQIDDRDFVMNSARQALGDPIVLPLQLLLDPLRKRFRYHFSGDRKTNSKEKPEWCFTQVSSWIQNHSHLLETKIQPLLNESGYSNLDARNEFTRGLLQELETKVSTILLDVVYDDVLMSHLIDEMLLFERELVTVLQYSQSAPFLLHLLLNEIPFHKWLTLENEYAVEHINAITSEDTNPTAWQPAYGGIVDADDTKVPECTEKLMAIIKGIEERYKYISSTRHLLQFVDLQRDLLLEFHQDIKTSAKSVHPLDPRHAAYLNASNYIAVVLKGWGESSFFLDLHYQTLSGLNEKKALSDTAIKHLHLLRQQDEECAESIGTIFDTVIEAFSSLVVSMENSIVDCIVESTKKSCTKYKKERWHSMSTLKDRFIVLDITPSAAELGSTLSMHLEFIEKHITSTLTLEIFEKIANKTDKLLLSEVILGNRFSEGGAEQLHYDISKCLVPLLNKGGVSDFQLFERTHEACKLLHLAQGSARLLQEELKAALKPPVDEAVYKDAVAALNDVKVHALSPLEAERILRLRGIQ